MQTAMLSRFRSFEIIKLDFLCFLHGFLPTTFLFSILANCVRDESCREKIAPISPNGSEIQDAAVSRAHRSTLSAF